MICCHKEAKAPEKSIKGEKVKSPKMRLFLYYTASFLMPSILLLDLYNRNHARNYIVFNHMLILVGVLAVCGLLLFVAFKLISHSEGGALILVSLSWLMFWLYEWLLGVARSLLPTFFLPSRVFLLLLFGIIGLVAISFNRLNPPFEKIRLVTNVLAICIIVLFIFNLIPGIIHEVNAARGRAEMAQLEYDERPYYIKRSFNIDPNLPSPDIYWIHMDGLMSIGTVERFWGLNYDRFREEIHARDFLMYEDAEVNGGFTRAALPALFSPAFYDSFWREQLDNADTMINPNRPDYLLGVVFPSVGLNDIYDVGPYLELLSAFFARGYEMEINTDYEYLPTSFEHVLGEQHQVRGFWHGFLRSDLPKLLSMTTPLPEIGFSQGENDEVGIRHLSNIEPVARFVFIESMDAHMGEGVQYRMEDTADIPQQARYYLYPSLGFEIAFQNMLNKVDEILIENPDAVIVLQSDHGFHLNSTHRILVEQGYPMEQVLELIHSVFSAVRIPNEFGGIEEPIAPLNITRELVNRFVGENYQLLLSE